MFSDKVIQADNKLFQNAIFKTILLEIKKDILNQF